MLPMNILAVVDTASKILDYAIIISSTIYFPFLLVILRKPSLLGKQSPEQRKVLKKGLLLGGISACCGIIVSLLNLLGHFNW